MAIAGAIGIIGANEIENGSVTNDKLANDSITVNGTSIDLGASETITAGKVLQVVSTTKTDVFSTTTQTTYVDVTGFSVTITPSSTSSKIYLVTNVQLGSNEMFYIRFLRGSTAIAIADDDSANRVESTQGGVFPASNNDKVAPMGASFLDSPNTTSATTYKLQIRMHTGSALRFNACFSDSDSTFTGRGVGTLTAFEIAG